MSIVKFISRAAGATALAVLVSMGTVSMAEAAGTKLTPDTFLLASVVEEGEGSSKVSVTYDPAAHSIAAVSSGDLTGVQARPTPGALLDPVQIELYPCGAWNNMAGTDAPLLTAFTRWSYTSPAGKTSSQTFTLDSAGRLKSTATGTYEYDRAGWLAGIVRTTGRGTSERRYQYDGQGHLTAYTVTQTGSEPTSYQFRYNDSGQLIRSESDDGSWCTYQYDGNGRLSSRRDYAAAAGGVQERRYSYDTNGCLSRIRFYNCGELEATDTFSYKLFKEVR